MSLSNQVAASSESHRELREGGTAGKGTVEMTVQQPKASPEKNALETEESVKDKELAA